MNPDILMMFGKTLDALPLYEGAEAMIVEMFPDAATPRE